MVANNIVNYIIVIATLQGFEWPNEITISGSERYISSACFTAGSARSASMTVSGSMSRNV